MPDGPKVEDLASDVEHDQAPIAGLFGGDALDYKRLAELVLKHPRQAIVEVFNLCLRNTEHFLFLTYVFARARISVTWKVLEKKHNSSEETIGNAIDRHNPGPLNGSADRGNVPLADLDDQIVIDYVARCATADPDFASRLKTAFAEAARVTMRPGSDGPQLQRWKDHKSEYNGPWHFLEANYGKENLTWPDIYKDRDLYFALKNNIKRNKVIPEGFNILDRVAVTDRMIASFGDEERKRAGAVSRALDRRRLKARKSAAEGPSEP